MSEVIKWCPVGSLPHHCPFCGSDNIRLSENLKLGSCNVCEKNFIIRFFHPKPNPQPKRSMSSDEFWAQMKAAGQVGNEYLK